MTYYPSLEEVILAHRRLIDNFGGSHGIRDRTALESALGRLRTGYYADIVEEAAALMEGVSQNHPFVDGNKRTAIAVAAAFLRVNGYAVEIDDLEAYQFLMRLYEAGEFRFDRVEAWLRKHTHTASP